MVKIPNFEDLKKMGTGLIDSAKSVNFGEMIDKVKTGIDNVGKSGGNIPQGDEGIKVLFEGLNASLNELVTMQAAQVTVTKKIQSQLADLGRVIQANQTVTPNTTTSQTTPEQPTGSKGQSEENR